MTEHFLEQDKGWGTRVDRWYCPKCGRKHSVLDVECRCGYNWAEAFAQDFVNGLLEDIEEEVD